jgi:hypothetical protein
MIDNKTFGDLPRGRPLQTYAGFGSSRPCAVCRLVIGPTDVEFELDFPDAPTLQLHRHCLLLWASKTSA